MESKSNWQKILEYYKQEKGSDLNGFEMWALSKWFIPYPLPLDNFEKVENIKVLENVVFISLDDIVQNYKPITDHSKSDLRNLHYQSLLDYKDNKCSLEIVNYIENYLNGK